jgi:hypothetical protein
MMDSKAARCLSREILQDAPAYPLFFKEKALGLGIESSQQPQSVERSEAVYVTGA